jgi:transcription elongation factor GreB
MLKLAGPKNSITDMKTMWITPEGLEKLKEELDHLWKVERPETTQKVAWAASLGDRSENADYHYNKKRLREIDKRVHYLRKCVDDLKVISYAPFQEGKVMFGAWVEIENAKGHKFRLRVVGGEEIIQRRDYISIDSPMAQALLKKEVGEEAIVQTPNGLMTWKIRNIEYEK